MQLQIFPCPETFVTCAKFIKWEKLNSSFIAFKISLSVKMVLLFADAAGIVKMQIFVFASLEHD